MAAPPSLPSLGDLRRALDDEGHVVLRGLLPGATCAALHGAAILEPPVASCPLPPALQDLRDALAAVVRRLAAPWQQAPGAALAGPAAGGLQLLPAGAFRPLDHSLAEPPCALQAMVLLSRRGIDLRGGELVLVEQRPRMQSKAIVVDLQAGDVALFPARHRPVQGSRGVYRVDTRHALTRVQAGQGVFADLLFGP